MVPPKSDKAAHGFGVHSIRYLVEKYHGEVLMRAADEKFCRNYTGDTALGVAQRATAHWERADGYVTFVDYVENIYVGYKFYETADAVGMSGFDYDSAVTYPFGFGLSYTTFDQSIANTTRNGDSVTVTVNVTNTGSVAGKSIVELYDTPPYTEGGLGLSKAVFLQPPFFCRR